MTIKETVLSLADNYAQNYGSREYDHRAALIAALDAADAASESHRNSLRTYEQQMLTLAQEEDEIRAALKAENAALRSIVESAADHHCLEDDECGQCLSCRARAALGGKT